MGGSDSQRSGELRRFFFFNDTATTEIYTLSLHDALPISDAWPEARERADSLFAAGDVQAAQAVLAAAAANSESRSEEHTSELQSQSNLVCRLLLEKKKNKSNTLATRDPPDATHSSRASPS